MKLWSVALLPTVTGRDFYAHPLGAHNNPGTFGSPLATVQACVDALVKPGDRCLLKAATWTGETATVSIRGKHGTAAAPIVIAAAGDGPVVFDGTIPVNTTWTKATSGKDHYTTTPNSKVWQLFARAKTRDALAPMDMQVPARWPNAAWSDKSMYYGPEHWAHAGPLGSGSHNVTTGEGHLHDAGACNASQTCCAYCNKNDLAKSGIDATGAVAILNMWADGTGVQFIEKHTPGSNMLHWNATWCAAEIAKRGKCGDGFREGRGRYYLEGLLSLLDAPAEWNYDLPSNVLSWRPPTSDAPDTYEIRSKNQTYAFEFFDSNYVTIANLSFFATALRAHDDASVAADVSSESPDGTRLTSLLSHLRFESLDFEYPAASHRMLGDLKPIPSMEIWTDATNGKSPPSPVGNSLISSAAEGCFKELSNLCGDNARTMATTVCLACVGKKASKFKSCTVNRATNICSGIRNECAAALTSLCKKDDKDPVKCAACVAKNAAKLYSTQDNCTAAATTKFCGAPPAPSPSPGPPSPGPPAPHGPGTSHCPEYTFHELIDISFKYADGMALQAQGSGWTFDNCAWRWNSWSGLGSAVPYEWQNNGAFVFAGMPALTPGPAFSRMSFANNGPSKAFRPPSAAWPVKNVVMVLMDFASELQLADDGCMVETGGNNSAHVLQSWMHDSGKSASRFDGDYKTGTRNGAFVGNVAWNTSGFMVKGDQNNVSFNTVFDGTDIGSSKAPQSRPPSQDGRSLLSNTSFPSLKFETWFSPLANLKTHVDGNLVDGVGTWKGVYNNGQGTAGKYNCTGDPKGASRPPFTGIFPDCPVSGIFSASNVVGSWLEVRGKGDVKFDMKEQLRDAWQRDFRPCPASIAATKGAGAYKVWAADDAIAWIPGAKDRTGTSQPSPRDGGVDVATDADLIFLGAYRSTQHVVYVSEAGGSSGTPFTVLKTLSGEDNVAHPKLKAKTKYSWRVDAKLADGSTLTGPVWSFTTGDRVSCP